MVNALVHRSAVFSEPDRRWRYELRRVWDEKPLCAFIGLNPSTADETHDDPTVRRCIGYAVRWGYGGLIMLNIFAYRSTDPRRLAEVLDPVGPRNDEFILSGVAEAEMTVAAWGVYGNWQRRGDWVRAMLGDRALHALGLTKSGEPRHPLYLRADAVPARL